MLHTDCVTQHKFCSNSNEVTQNKFRNEVVLCLQANFTSWIEKGVTKGGQQKNIITKYQALNKLHESYPADNILYTNCINLYVLVETMLK